MLPKSTDVLIVGAGPAGLALAIRLQQAGVNHLLVDKRETPLNTSRAAVIHAHTLEVLERIGVADRLDARGLRLARFTIRDREHPLLQLDFSRVGSRFNHLLMLPQEVTEEVLCARLEELGGHVYRGREATGIRNGRDRAEATIRAGEESHVVTARYIVGADGIHSLVRQSAGIDFEGESYGQAFILADVGLDWPLGQREVSLFFAPEGLAVVAPLPGGHFRIVATVDDAPEVPGATDVQRVLAARGPRNADVRVGEVAWSSRFRVHHRLARAFRRDRLFLMGDAAHVHSPAGGQGMNCGLVDACVLGELLADVVQGRRTEAELDRYEALRRPAAAHVLTLASRLTGLATMQSAPKRMLRNAALKALNTVPAFRSRVAGGLSGVDRRRLSVVG